MSRLKATRTEVDVAFDAEVGRRIRLARLAAGLSQGELAAGVGVTFQQLQKYEKGLNRVAASRLVAISRVLGLRPYVFLDQEEEPASPPPFDGAIQALFARCTPAQQKVVKDMLEIMAGPELSSPN